MAVITQYYDIDLKATGEYPVVKMSQFDTGSRTIVFTVYDGHDLAHIDGMVARVDGTRCDGVEFSQSCTVGTGSKVSFEITQEMTKISGKHSAELVIFDADGDPIGTQNFVIEVEAAPMVRDSAASADDRTLYDQFTDSVSKTVSDKITQLNGSVSKTLADKIAQMDSKYAQMDSKYNEFASAMTSKADAMDMTVHGISGLVGASSRAVTVREGQWEDNTVTPHQYLKAILQYDPNTALCVLDVRSTFKFDNLPPDVVTIMGGIDSKYLPAESEMDAQCADDMDVFPVYHDVGRDEIYLTRGGDLRFMTWAESTTNTTHRPWAHVSWYARGGKYIDVTPLPSGVGVSVATSDKAGIVKIGGGIHVAADGTIDVQALADKIDQVRSMYDDLSPATYEVGSGIEKGQYYQDYKWDFCRLRVVGGVCTLTLAAKRGSLVWDAKPWEISSVLVLPDGLGAAGDVMAPLVNDANNEPANNTLLWITGEEVRLTPIAAVTFKPDTWFKGSVSWVAAGK